jgi:L,D-transpeptidase YcbB
MGNWKSFAGRTSAIIATRSRNSTSQQDMLLPGSMDRNRRLRHSLIELFRDAGRKGLDPEDYDASRWEERIRSLQGSANASAVARLDVALSVCTMRYVSALRVGRINPKHFAFGLSVEQKKYDLATFLRDRILTTSDPQPVLDEVEPPFAAYRRTEQALARYIELAHTDGGQKLPAVTKPIEPGQPYPGVARLASILRLVGDLPMDATLPGDMQTYGGPLVDALKRFQRRHGLDAMAAWVPPPSSN